MDTQEAWRISEAFDEECLKSRIILQGLDDETRGEGSGKKSENKSGKRRPKYTAKNGRPNSGAMQRVAEESHKDG